MVQSLLIKIKTLKFNAFTFYIFKQFLLSFLPVWIASSRANNYNTHHLNCCFFCFCMLFYMLLNMSNICHEIHLPLQSVMQILSFRYALKHTLTNGITPKQAMAQGYDHLKVHRQ